MVDRQLTPYEVDSIERWATGVDRCEVKAKEAAIARCPLLTGLQDEMDRLRDITNRAYSAGLEDIAFKCDDAVEIIARLIEERTRPKVDRAVAAFKKCASYKPVVWETKGASLNKSKCKVTVRR